MLLLIFSIGILVMSVIIHEVSHGYAAFFLGDHTAYYQDRLTLNPLKHIDPLGSIVVPIITSLVGFPFGWAKPVPFNPYNLKNPRSGEFVIALAGPVSNIVIALFFGLIIRFGSGLSASFIGLALEVVVVNYSLALFNLIPIPPLDGSRILFSLLPFRFSQIRYKLERYALVIVFIVILFPVVTSWLGSAVVFATAHTTGIPLSTLIGAFQ